MSDRREPAHVVSFSPPLIEQEEVDEVIDTLRSDWITTGPKTKRFEAEFAKYLEAPSALGLSSCTAGLHTALLASGIGRGDEVITTTLTFAATVNVIEHVGAKPVLVDVEPDTLNIDPSAIAAAITSRTKAVIPVHYAGHPAELDAIEILAQRHGLTIIEDAAHALPAEYKERKIGSGVNPVAFSFYATKNLSTAEGGMLTGAPEFLEQARVLSLHGMSRDAWNRYGSQGSWYYEIVSPGFKYNMTDIQASLGLWQLRKLDRCQQRRCEIVRQYNAAFANLEPFELPIVRPHVKPAWHLYVLRLRPELFEINRDQFVAELRARGICTSVHFIPIHIHPYYRDKYGYRSQDFPIAFGNYQRMLSLPLSPRLNDEDIAAVIRAVYEVAGVTTDRSLKGSDKLDGQLDRSVVPIP